MRDRRNSFNTTIDAHRSTRVRPCSRRFVGKVFIATAALTLANLAQAEIVQSANDAFVIEVKIHVAAPPAKVYAAIPDIAHWWSSEHSWSGEASNFSMKAEAGACFCERWSGGSVEHGRVTMAIKDSLLRLDAPLGPLQGQALKAIWTFAMKAADTGTDLTVSFLVNGSSLSHLDKSAPGVNAVLTEEIGRFKLFVETGKPTA